MNSGSARSGEADGVLLDRLHPGDAARCAELEARLFAGDDPWTAGAFRGEMAAGHHYLAARLRDGTGPARLVGARLIGYGGAALLPAPPPTAPSKGSTPIGRRSSDRAAGEHADRGRCGDSQCPPTSRTRSEAAQSEAEVHTIGVDPEYQGRGIGRLLLRGLLDAADAIDAVVYLEVRTDNAAALGLYRGEGFEVVGTRRRYYASGADAHTMRRAARGAVPGQAPR